MGDLRLTYKGPTHEVEVQIPLALMGRSDLDSFSLSKLKNLIGVDETEDDAKEEPEDKKEKFKWSFGNRKEKKKMGKKSGNSDEKLTLATGGMIMAAMILSAIKSGE